MASDDISCPVCSSENYTSISINLHRCRACGISFNSGYYPLDYNSDYFLADYKKQYGCSYLEDFQNIYNVSKKRLLRILGLIKKNKNLSLLDIGSAMGFFLKCSLDLGIKDLAGVEISEFASRYCSEEYGIEVINKSFEGLELEKNYDIVSAWFFLEHCANPRLVLKNVFSRLNSGGVFAFSAPSIFGPSYYFNREEWIKSHPADHLIDFTPASVKKILREIGFRKVITRPCGFHPERVISMNNPFFKPFSLFFKIFSQVTSFSDTIEVYAIK